MIYRILIFYIGSLAILLSLYPWGKVVEGGSPFVLIFHALNSNLVATVLNIVVLTAALSVYNSCVYCNSRMLYGPAQQGNGPKSLLKVDGRGVPVVAIGISALATALCVLINYLIRRAFELLMALVVSALVINWAMISPAHLKFRAAKTAKAWCRSSKPSGTRSATTCACCSWPASGDHVPDAGHSNLGAADPGMGGDSGCRLRHQTAQPTRRRRHQPLNPVTAQ